MTVNELKEALNCKVFCMPCGDREVSGGYAGDLLSWVMGRAQSGDVWLTIMSNINIVAVATLADVSCIMLTEGVEPDEEVVEKAQSVGVNLLGCLDDTFGVCEKISKLK